MINNIKDDKSIIEETKIEQEIDKKKNKKEKKKKQVPDTTYIDINIKNSFLENLSLSLLKKGIKITTEYTKKKSIM